MRSEKNLLKQEIEDKIKRSPSFVIMAVFNIFGSERLTVSATLSSSLLSRQIVRDMR